MSDTNCPRCGHMKLWEIRRQRRRCARCRYEWRPGPPLDLSRTEWRIILKGFLRESGIPLIAREAGVSRSRVAHALTLVRIRMAESTPIFLNAAQRLPNRLQKNDWSMSAADHSIFGVLHRSGQVWAQVAREREARRILSSILRGSRESIVSSDLSPIPNGNGSHSKIRHFGSNQNGLIGFWTFLGKRRLQRKDPRHDRYPLYLAEYVWRYNHRSLSVEQRVPRVMKLLMKAQSNAAQSAQGNGNHSNE